MGQTERDIYNRLLRFFHNSPEKVEDWLTTKQWNVDLSPQQLIDIGMAEDVLGMVRQLTTPRVRTPRAATY
jgi:hypothetical protein